MLCGLNLNGFVFPKYKSPYIYIYFTDLYIIFFLFSLEEYYFHVIILIALNYFNVISFNYFMPMNLL
jgi:hypothetical protein